MTNKTHASVINWVDRTDCSEHNTFEQAAIDRTKSMFTKVADLSWFYHDAIPDRDGDEPAVVPFNSEAGRRQVESQLSRTTNRRTEQLAQVLKLVEDTTPAESAQSYDLLRACRPLGTYFHPDTTHLFDGTQWSFGSPILNAERVDEIQEHHDPSNLAIVNVQLRY